jgi:hypothetical protein
LGIAIATPDTDEQEKSRIKRELRYTIKHIGNVLHKHFQNPADDEFVAAMRARLGQVIA